MSNWSYQDNNKFLSKTRKDRQLIKELLGASSKSNNTKGEQKNERKRNKEGSDRSRE